MKGALVAIPRREREKLRQRQEILDAALSLFSEKGYHNVTMHEIAERAEFAIGTLYKFFRNKEDLYMALMLGKAEEFNRGLLEAIGKSEDEMEKLRSFVKTKRELSQAHLPVIRLYFSEAHGESFNLTAGLDAELHKRRSVILEIVASVFAEGMRKKRFNRIADPRSLAIALDAITSAFHLLWLEAPEHYPYPEDPDAVLNILYLGLVNP